MVLLISCIGIPENVCVCLVSLWFCHYANKLFCEILFDLIGTQTEVYWLAYSTLFIVCFLRKYLSIDPLGTYFYCLSKGVHAHLFLSGQGHTAMK